MPKSLIYRKASKAADSVWRKHGMFARQTKYREPRQKTMTEAEKSVDMKQPDSKCTCFIAEKDNPYPLCDNPDCIDRHTCNLSMYMLEPLEPCEEM
jgi:hypothetical protein